ncbi:MAG: zinc dependent phospholipase C family protein [Sandaracinaceae bacterium]|nr:zinc dependent phospholipase C family protein [Sandaracinaceae bacterium]
MRTLAVLGLWLVPSLASANGAFTHVHISQLAADGLGPGALQTLLASPTNRAALEAGSMFPDSGYAIDDPYGELAHWEPFLGALIAQLRATYGGDLSSPDAQRAVAFALGVASHGMADQSYDTTLLDRAFEVDGPEDSTRPVDQYADYFLVVDHGVALDVEPWGPYGELSAAMAAVGHDVTQSTLINGQGRMSAVLDVQGNPRIAGNLYWDAWAQYPFLGTFVYDLDAVGSVPWLGALIADYWQVVLDRLDARDDVDAQLVIRTLPEDGGVNRPVSLDETVAWGRPALWFGYGIERDQIRPLLSLSEAGGGAAVPFTVQTAYGGRDRNLVFLRPDAPLAYDTEYTIELAAGVETLDGRTTTEPFLFSFRTRCAPDRLAECPPLAPPLVTGEIPRRPERPDAGPGSDAGSGALDAGTGGASGGCGCRVTRPASPARGAAPFGAAVLGLFALRRRGSAT